MLRVLMLSLPATALGLFSPQGGELTPNSLLRDWKQANQTRHNLTFKFKRTFHDHVFGAEEVTEGVVKANGSDVWRIDQHKGGTKLHTVLLTHDGIRWFDFEAKIERIRNGRVDRISFFTPFSLAGLFDGQMLIQVLGEESWFYRSSAIDELVGTCELKTSADAHWVHMNFKPRKALSDFQRAQVVLEKRKLWVKRAWFEQANGNTIRLDLEEPTSIQRLTTESLFSDLPKNFRKATFPPRH